MKTSPSHKKSLSDKSFFDQILKSFVLKKRKSHQPHFRVKKESTGWRIFDGEKAIAFFHLLWFDIWSFSPFESDEIGNAENLSKTVDLHTIRNTTINLGMQGWPCHWLEQGAPEKHVKATWVKKSGTELSLRLTATFDHGESGEWLLKVHYDPSWGRYRYTWEIDVRKYGMEGMEGFNLMTAGALTDREKDRRWTHSVCEDIDGNPARIVHSNALFSCTDYATGAGPVRDHSGPWRNINASYPSTWIGYMAHRSFNPVILIHRTNIPLTFATCSQLFDEHIIWNRAGRNNLDENGFFRFRMTNELVNLSASLAKNLLNKASDPIHPTHWQQNDIALPFYVDRINTFDQELDPWKPEASPMLFIPRSKDGAIAWDRTVGYGDHASIRFTGTKKTGRVELHPTGAVCRTKPHHRYRLTGWIKTQNIDRFARLELSTFEYSYTNVIKHSESESVSGTSDWTVVASEIDTGDSAYVLPKLVIYGTGTAWFDHLQLEEVNRENCEKM